ncbi:hypothetical protein EJ04DRAFT_595149 [Polyplosphaeria fusca]|uniref:Polyketide synthase n=1 Tax=Polyplosphaeria fusca TaxID=682080 RepID=A0A9P4V218_9PLEO|nr:hypothetical protein EJ04DRAFT_595149 [Polyplosphaeria fusca]
MHLNVESSSVKESSPPSPLSSLSSTAGFSHEKTSATLAPNTFDEPIAIVGLSLRLPGDATSVETFWDMLVQGQTTASEFPEDRVNHASHHSSDGSAMGTIRPRRGHFLKGNLAAFDSAFFAMSAQEVEAMDPQQRVLLETTYHAFENAGIPIDRIYGSDASVHTGCFTADYLLMTAKDPELMLKYSGTGGAGAMLSNRISSFFNLHGPSVTTDTACSSSLVALDQSCQSLKLGQSSVGIVAGCNLIFTLDTTIGLSNMGFLSPEGISYSFDHRANGYARGEGFGVVVLKRLSDAVRDDDTIRAVIRGTGCNQDGNTPLAQPSQDAQARLIAETYRRAGLDPSQTRYVEAHGTGTSVGDPLEATAIGKSFGTAKSPAERVYVSSLKANFGHLEGAAGIAGLIKTVLMLERGVIPPLARLEKVNPNIDEEFLNIQFPRNAIPWPERGLRRASVNSFGFGGTNAHAIIEDAYHHLRIHGIKGKHCTRALPPDEIVINHESTGNECLAMQLVGSRSTRRHVLVMSAQDEWSLKELGLAFDAWFQLSEKSFNEVNILPSLAHTMLQRRSILPWRSFAVTDPSAHLRDITISKACLSSPKDQLSLAFVFTGQGAQWCGMGEELFGYEVFRRSVTDAISYLINQGCYLNLAGIFTGHFEQANQVDSPEVAQPVCTILQVALADLLASVNVHPAVVIGHSSGEIAAAYVAGAFSREVAWRLAFLRGECSSKLAAMPGVDGAMVAVGLSEAAANEYLESITSEMGNGNLTVACVNSPVNVTVSGDRGHVEELAARVGQNGSFARLLQVPVAYHGPHMKLVADEYHAAIGHIEPRTLEHDARFVNMISSVTGELISFTELCEPRYWVRNLVSQVKFNQALNCTFSEPRKNIVKKLDLSHRRIVWATDILEIGPHGTLSGPIRDSLRPFSHAKDVRYISALTRKQDASMTLLTAIAQLHCRGYAPNMSKLNANPDVDPETVIAIPCLPQYPFNHSRTFWHESRLSKNLRLRRFGRDPFLGSPVADWNPQDARWRHFLKLEDSPWIGDHVINGSIIYPAAGMLTMAMNAALQLHCNEAIAAFEFRDVTFHSGLDLSSDKGVEVQLQLTFRGLSSTSSSSNYDWRFRVHRSEWSEVSRGQIRVIPAKVDENDVDRNGEEGHLRERSKSRFEAIATASKTAVDGPAMYERLWHCGYHFGHRFKRIRNARQTTGKAWAEVYLLDTEESDTPIIIHPATLDGMLQVLLPGAAHDGKDSRLATSVPTSINRLWISRNGLKHGEERSVKVAGLTQQTGYRHCSADIVAFSHNGCLRMVGEGIETTAITDSVEETSARIQANPTICWNVVCKPDLGHSQKERLEDYLVRDAPVVTPSSQYLHNLEVVLLAFLLRTSLTLENVGFTASHRHLDFYMRWMRSKLQATNANITEARRLLSDEDNFVAFCNEVAHQYPKYSNILYRAAHHLTDMLSGHLDPLSLMFKGTDMADFYQIILKSANFITPLSRWFDLYTHKFPNASILEVGAGTGAMTKQVMKILLQSSSKGLTPKYSQYCFTDISPSFFAQAQEDFSACPNMTFEVLDLEQDPLGQGYEPESFELIFASLVLHATSSIHRSLTHLKMLLKPGGRLIIIEITNTESFSAGFVFGLLPGWWLHTSGDSDREGRLSPCLNKDEWDSLLLRSGFTGVDHVFWDNIDEGHRHLSLLVSTREHVKHSPANNDLVAATVIAGHGVVEAHVQMCEQQLATLGVAATRQDHSTSASATEVSFDLCIIIDGPTHPILEDLDRGGFDRIRDTVLNASKVLWISQKSGNIPNAGAGSVYGFARALRSEGAVISFTIFEADISLSIDQQRTGIERILQACVCQGPTLSDAEISEQDGLPHIPRVIEDVSISERIRDRSHRMRRQDVRFSDGNLCLTVKTPGLLDTLTFEQLANASNELGSHELQVRVKAIGVNFKDCLVALGRIADTAIGTDCAGIVERAGSGCKIKAGDRVAVLALNTYSSTVRCHEDLVVKIPDFVSFVDAAKLPTNFVTAYHSLIEIGRLNEGEKVLIHAGAGGTGQAAIQVAQLFGAEVFVTVGSQKKKSLVMNEYSILEDHIFYSRDISFAEGIRRQTGGHGVDLVLNSLAGEQLMASWSCLAPYGRFLEIGKRDLLANEKLPMLQFARNISFAAVDVAAMIRERPALIQKSLKAVIDLMAEAKIRIATPLKVFGINEVEDALRYLQGGVNAGGVAIEVAEDAVVSALVPRKPSLAFDGNATYAIAGGLGGQGRSITRWMSSKGAKNFLLLSRSGAKSEEAKTFIAEMSGAGVNIEAPPCDIANLTVLCQVIKEARERLPPIKGCIQASMVLEDSLFTSMTYAGWKAATEPKICGSWNLHSTLPQDLDFFILFSSVSGIIGSIGQSNYVAGNTYQDALATFRLSQGQKAVSLDLGIMKDEGYLVSRSSLIEELIRTKKMVEIPQDDLFVILEHYCDPELRIEDMQSQVLMGLALPAELSRRGEELVQWMERPLFSHLHNYSLASAPPEPSTMKSATRIDLSNLTSAMPLEKAATVVTDAIQEKLAHVLSRPIQDIDTSKSMHAHGVDSLVAVELRNWFLKAIKVDVPIFEILGGGTIAALGRGVAEKFGATD